MLLPVSISPSEAVAEEVRAGLARKRISQARAAKHLNIGQASMSRRLAGTYPFTVDELYKLGELLGVPVRQLLAAERAEAAS
jgi:transcriptional regulator with XRE-family HTH domain